MTSAAPSPSFVFSHPAHVIALGGGAGLSPVAPGTAGTLAGWALGWLIGATLAPLDFLSLVGGLFVLGVWACEATGRHLGVSDHGAMVWDEIVAFLLMLAVLPRELDWQLAGFLLFRAFDIAKPPPIGWVERRFRGGFGVMIDDLLAAGMALLVLAVLKRMM